VGNLGAISQVWVNEGGIANIVLLKVLEKVWRTTYDSHRGMNAGHHVIHMDKGDIKVGNNKKGMPYPNLKEVEAEVALSLLQTIRGNMEGFPKQEVDKARAAREAQAMVGYPTDRNFLGMVRANMIPNCPITPTAGKNANVIFSPDLAGVRGTTVRIAPESMRTNYAQIPQIILERYQLITLAVDVMFVNRVPFLVSVSRGLNLITAECTPTCTAKTLASKIDQIAHLYARGGFTVGTVLMDNKFKKLCPLVPCLDINTTATQEHVPEIEQCIRLIKKQGRGILNTLPFKQMPQVMLIELIYHVVLWLNAFPSQSGVSNSLSPRELVLWHCLDFKNIAKPLLVPTAKPTMIQPPLTTWQLEQRPLLSWGRLTISRVHTSSSA
jgi:hypothetical protein